MKIDISNSKMKMPVGVEKIVKKLMDGIIEEQIYDLSVEICNGLEIATGKDIPDWSGAFQTISDISEGYLFDMLDKEKYFNLLGQVSSGGLTFYKIEEIISQAAERLGYAS